MCTEVGTVAGVAALQTAAESSARDREALENGENPFLRVSREPWQAPRGH